MVNNLKTECFFYLSLSSCKNPFFPKLLGFHATSCKNLSFKLLKHSWLRLCSLAWGDVLKPGEMQTLLPCDLLCRSAPPGPGLRHPGPLPNMPAACTILGTIKISALHFQNAPLGGVINQGRIPDLYRKGKLLIAGFIKSLLRAWVSGTPHSRLGRPFYYPHFYT